jgi:GntR family transcriptional repressor for pyruvate dehydrogenase complex
MSFSKIEPERLSQAVVRQIEELILRGILRPGERLPSERELSEQLGVSRPSLREAIADLQSRGLLDSRAGSGVYVAEVLGSAFSPALVDLIGGHDAAVLDYIAFRRDMEGLAIARAARLGSDTDLAVVDAVFQRMAAPGKRAAGDDARLDAEFHMSIIEASHNIIMLHMMRAMFDLLREGVSYNRQAMFAQHTTREDLLEQHRQINSALQCRDAEAARSALERHLDYVEAALLQQRRDEANEMTARRRLDRQQQRLPR